jgi:hypothetical protein
MTALPADRAEQLRAEKALLLRADSDIEQGCRRLRNQQDLLLKLQAAGHQTTQAVRLVAVLQQTLVQWERHRMLIEERVAYLEREPYPGSLMER